MLPNKWEGFSMECPVSFRVSSDFLQCNTSSVRPNTPRFPFPWCFCRQNQEGHYSWNTHCINQGYHLPETHSVRPNTRGFLSPWCYWGKIRKGIFFRNTQPHYFWYTGIPFRFRQETQWSDLASKIPRWSTLPERAVYSACTYCVLCMYLHTCLTPTNIYCLHLLSVYCAQLALLRRCTLMLRRWLHTYGTCVKWASPGGQVLFWNQYV